MWTSHFFHRCNWCHVTDVAPQLYMIVGLGIKLKSMSVRSWRWISLRLPQNPRTAARVLFKRANLSFVLMYVMTDAYGTLRFSVFFLPVFCWLCCHPSTCKNKGIQLHGVLRFDSTVVINVLIDISCLRLLNNILRKFEVYCMNMLLSLPQHVRVNYFANSVST